MPKLVNISNSAFSNCASLESIYMSEQLKIIGKFAFNKCTSLKHVYLVDSTGNKIHFKFQDNTVYHNHKDIDKIKDKIMKIFDTSIFVYDEKLYDGKRRSKRRSKRKRSKSKLYKK
jgi:hypothetical protein